MKVQLLHEVGPVFLHGLYTDIEGAEESSAPNPSRSIVWSSEVTIRFCSFMILTLDVS